MTRYMTTPAGLRRTERRLQAAKDHYADICATNEDAAGAGDTSVWHDNFAYEENQRQMHAAARRVRDMQKVLATMVLVRPPAAPAHVIVGTRVTLEDAEGKTQTWAITGYEDGEPREGRISYTAPLAAALLGAEEGDLRRYRRHGEVVEVEVVKIERAHEEMDE